MMYSNLCLNSRETVPLKRFAHLVDKDDPVRNDQKGPHRPEAMGSDNHRLINNSSNLYK